MSNGFRVVVGLALADSSVEAVAPSIAFVALPPLKIFDPLLILLANSRRRPRGRIPGRMGNPAKGRDAVLGDSAEFANSIHCLTGNLHLISP